MAGCRTPGEVGGRTRTWTAPSPSPQEATCAWFGDQAGSTLYFGQAAFWDAMRAGGGDPTADLRVPGPQWIGRFDLDGLSFLPPLDVTRPGARGGVWDVLAHPSGLVYFTTYFDPAGSVDPESGATLRFEGAGLGLNELALGPEGTLLVSRYGFGPGEQGGIVVLDPAGRVLAEYPLEGPPGYRVAAKSVAWDPVRQEIWANTDLLPEGDGPIRHDARVLDRGGRERLRFERPELQFMHFGPDGTGYFAELDGELLRLRIRRPENASAPLLTGLLVPLDPSFPKHVDFVQEIRSAADGSVVVTRWSGLVHRVRPDGRVDDLHLPRADPGGLYYTGVLRGRHLCATYCSGVSVVCRDLDH